MTRFTLLTLPFEMTGWVKAAVQTTVTAIMSPMYLLVLREREECRPVSVMTEAGLEQGQGRLPLLELSPAPPPCSITLPCSMIT